MDLLDFYRGTLSTRRLGVLVRQLPPEAALSRALNDNEPPWTRNDHLTADLWALWAKKDHPRRAEKVAKAKSAQKLAKVIHLRAVYENKKRTYGLGGDVT